MIGAPALLGESMGGFKAWNGLRTPVAYERNFAGAKAQGIFVVTYGTTEVVPLHTPASSLSSSAIAICVWLA
jgi:hypothetical protein